MKRLYEKETKETIWSFATKGAAAVLFVLLNAVLARTLGPALWGSWSFLFSVITIVILIAHQGLNSAARAYAAQHNGTPALRAVLRDSLLLRIAISAVFTTAFLLLYDRIAGWIGRPDLAGPLKAAAPLVFLMGFSEYLKQVFTGIHRLKFHFYMNVLEFGGKLALCVIFLQTAVRLENVLLAFWLAITVSVAAGFYFWARFYRAKSDSQPPSGDADTFIKPLFKYSLPLFLISIGFVIMTEIDTVMLGLLSTDLEVGQFAAAKQLANKLPQVALAVSMGTMPGFAKMGRENSAAMQVKFRNVLRLNTLLFVPGGAVLILLAPWLIPLVFGPGYAPAVLPLQVLTVWVVLTSYNMFFNALLDYQGRAVRRAVNFLLTIGLTVALNLVLIPRYGALGAALSTTVSFLPYVVLNGYEVRGLFKAA